MKKAVDVARRAAEFLASGFCKNRLGDDQGGVCANGAINMAMYGHYSWHLGDHEERAVELQVRSAAEAVVAEQFPDRQYPPPHGHHDRGLSYHADRHLKIHAFNNHPDTTQAEMVSVFEKAAANLANGASNDR
jgi:hypothetical protein